MSLDCGDFCPNPPSKRLFCDYFTRELTS
jgi:hypothetical protein